MRIFLERNLNHGALHDFMSRFEREKLRIGVVFTSRTVTPSEVARKEITDKFLKKYSEIVRTIKQNLEETLTGD